MSVSLSDLSLRLKSTLQLRDISIKELRFQILPTWRCFLCVSAKSVVVNIKTTPNKGSILRDYKTPGILHNL